MKSIAAALVKFQSQLKLVNISEFEHYKVSESGFVLNKNGKTVKQRTHRLGYKVVILYSKPRTIKKNFYVHRLVALTYLPIVNSKNEVNHKDGIKSNNHVSNLEWVNRSENIKHAIKNNLIKLKKGDDHPSTILTELDKEYIKLKKLNGEATEKQLAKMFNVTIASINLVR